MCSNLESTEPMSIIFVLRNLHYVSPRKHHFVRTDTIFNINLQNLFLHKFQERCSFYKRNWHTKIHDSIKIYKYYLESVTINSTK